MSIMEKAINYVSKHQEFWVVMFITFSKLIAFHYICFDYLAFSSIMDKPLEFFAFYFAKLAPAIFIASFVFIVKKRWWTIVVSFIIDLWLIANIVYFRIFGFFLDEETLFMASNMNGFWASILPFIDYKLFIFIILSFLLCVYWWFHRTNKHRNWGLWGISIFIVVLIGVLNYFLGYRETAETDKGMRDGWKFNCISAVQYVEDGLFPMYNWCLNQWMEAESPLHFFVAWPYSYIYKFTNNVEVSLTKNDKERLSSFLKTEKAEKSNPQYNLILIIGESFESWALSVMDENNRYVTPNLLRLIHNGHTLYCNKLKSQVLRGSSGDGQMIINTGLLPISSGAACMSHKNNVFPNIAGVYKNSLVINPAGDVWNQKQMTERYGYNDLIQKNLDDWSAGDSVAFSEALNIIDECNELLCMQIITITTHAPFNCGNRVNMSFPKDMPNSMYDYLNCYHYADSCLGILLNKLEQDSLLANTTIVITSDHTIFKKNMLYNFQPFAKKYNYPIPQEESYCPLIIISPNIQERIVVEDLCYQMDIYPTIMHCIGADDYYWKGVGVNLLDSVARHNRIISEEEAYILSDKLIRSNYFNNLK